MSPGHFFTGVGRNGGTKHQPLQDSRTQETGVSTIYTMLLMAKGRAQQITVNPKTVLSSGTFVHCCSRSPVNMC